MLFTRVGLLFFESAQRPIKTPKCVQDTQNKYELLRQRHASIPPGHAKSRCGAKKHRRAKQVPRASGRKLTRPRARPSANPKASPMIPRRLLTCPYTDSAAVTGPRRVRKH